MSEGKCSEYENCPLINDNPGTCPFIERIVKIETNQKWLIKFIGADIGIGILAAILIKVIGG